MAPLGLHMTTIGALGGPGLLGGTGKPTRDDYFWECGGSGELTPIPAVTDSNDMWDLDTADLDYKPQLAAIHAAEGFWEPDGNNDINPIAGACS